MNITAARLKQIIVEEYIKEELLTIVKPLKIC